MRNYQIRRIFRNWITRYSTLGNMGNKYNQIYNNIIQDYWLELNLLFIETKIFKECFFDIPFR